MAVVLDASAILALLKNEPGAERVKETLLNATRNAAGYAATVSAVNLTEVYEQLGASEQADAAIAAIEQLVETIRYDGAQIKDTALLREPTRHLGLSLADRACLALAQRSQTAAVTADRTWSELELGIEVIQIR